MPELYRVCYALSSLGLTVDNDGVIVDVTTPFGNPAQSPAAVAGLQVGDKIDYTQMRCLPWDGERCASLISVMGDLGGLGYSLPHFQAKLAILPNSGHMNFVDQPDLWEKAVEGFLDDSASNPK